MDRRHLSETPVVSILACQIFCFTPCLLASCFTISVPAQRGEFQLTRLPGAPSHAFQELLMKNSPGPAFAPLSVVPQAPLPSWQPLCWACQHTWGWASGTNATFLSIYQWLFSSWQTLPSCRTDPSLHWDISLIGHILKCDCQYIKFSQSFRIFCVLMFLRRHGTSVYTVLTLRTVLSLIRSLVLEDFDFCNWAEDVTPVSIGSVLKSPWPSFWRLWGSTVSWVANRKQSDGHLWKTALCYRKIVILKNKYTCVKTRLVRVRGCNCASS